MNVFEEIEFQPRSRCNVAAAVLGAGALGAGANIFGAITGSNAQKDAMNANIDQQNRLFNIIRGQAQPFIDAGGNALSSLMKLITPGPNQTDELNNIPGFQFAQDWGQKAVQALGSIRGLGGNVLSEGSKYATGLAQQGFGQIANLLQGVVNTGTGALGTLSGGVNNLGTQIGNSLTGIGNASAGAATSIGNSIGNFGNSMSTAAILQKLTGDSGIYSNPSQYPMGYANAPAYPNPSGGSWFIND